MSPALADDFICRQLSTVGATQDQLVTVPTAETSQLKIAIDPKTPAEIKIEFSGTGDPAQDGARTFVSGRNQISLNNGLIAATLFAEANSVVGIGTLLVDRSGALWFTETAWGEGKVVHYFVRGQCEKI